MFRNQGELFQPDVSGPVSSDPADTKFLHCAQAAQADYIVTGNKRDFPDAPYGVTRVVSAGELLDQIYIRDLSARLTARTVKPPQREAVTILRSINCRTNRSLLT
jgi:hypothetical protein